MGRFRETLKRRLPRPAHELLIDLKARFAPAPLEEIKLHDYLPEEDPSSARRLTLVIPSLASRTLFGGVATGIELLFQIARRSDAAPRILVDDFDREIDRPFVDTAARRAGFEPGDVEIVPRTAEAQPVKVAKNETFVTYNWWIQLNIRAMLEARRARLGGPVRPTIYLIQEYEPLFYPMSSTHLFARAAFETKTGVWGVFNSSNLLEFFHRQGHAFEKEFLFEPTLSRSLRPHLLSGPTQKEKCVLVYGRPLIPRNCFSAVVAGLRAWAERYPQFADWRVVSAGYPHAPVALGGGRQMAALGKLSMDQYAERLRRAAVGLSLMASPHPSYPPLEMAHFGVRTLTNAYLSKDPAKAHDNIVSLQDIAPGTIADALARECAAFEEDPSAGWRARSHMPGYLGEDPYPFLDALAAELKGLDAALETASEPWRN